MCLGAIITVLFNHSFLVITRYDIFVEKLDVKRLGTHSGCMILASNFVIYGLIVNITQN